MANEPLYSELVPLREAAAAAYHALSLTTPKRLSPESLAERRRETALAIAALAPIYSENRRPLSFEEVEKMLAGDGDQRLFIHRVDLVRSVEMLLGRPAHPSHSRPDDHHA